MIFDRKPRLIIQIRNGQVVKIQCNHMNADIDIIDHDYIKAFEYTRRGIAISEQVADIEDESKENPCLKDVKFKVNGNE